MGVLDFQNSLKKILFAVHLKHSSIWPSADAKPMLNDLVHAMPRQYIIHICSLNYGL